MWLHAVSMSFKLINHVNMRDVNIQKETCEGHVALCRTQVLEISLSVVCIYRQRLTETGEGCVAMIIIDMDV